MDSRFSENIQVIEFITEPIKNWEAGLTAGRKTLEEVKIQKGIS